MYRVLHEKSSITVSFAEHLKFWVNSDKSKEKQLELGHSMF